ncbi:MAG: HAMP domain-containing histidine kinase [Marinibacterium sp.]|nr:HAMP domain-containing histidine kinase [Marinibacterium sp.]
MPSKPFTGWVIAWQRVEPVERLRDLVRSPLSRRIMVVQLALGLLVLGASVLHPVPLWALAAVILGGLGAGLWAQRSLVRPLRDLADLAQTRPAPNRACTDELIMLEAAIRRLRAEFQGRIDDTARFAADVAHEIKNPLASLRSAMAVLEQGGPPDQSARVLAVMAQDLRRIDRLIGEVSAVTRLDSDLNKEDERCFDLLALLQAIEPHLAGQAQDLGVDFLLDMPQGSIMIRGREDRLAQVIGNLVSNALSFCDGGDVVRLWVRRRGAMVRVAVEDTGPGIAESLLDKIFRRFFSDRPPGQFGENSGLGLAISRQIVEAHGGTIRAENIRPGPDDPGALPMGARLVVDLPI